MIASTSAWNAVTIIVHIASKFHLSSVFFFSGALFLCAASFPVHILCALLARGRRNAGPPRFMLRLLARPAVSSALCLGSYQSQVGRKKIVL